MQHELKVARTTLRARDEEMQKMKQQIQDASGGLVGQLQSQIRELQQDLGISRENSATVQQNMEEMERSYVDRILGL